MTVDTDTFAALTEEVAAVHRYTRAAYRLGMEAGQQRASQAVEFIEMLGRRQAPAPAPRHARPRHLQRIK
jgi:hypothetical protein